MSQDDIDDVGHHALGDKPAAVADHAHGLAIAGKQRMGSVAHVGAGRRVGGQHSALGGVVRHQQVNADGA